MNAQICGVVLLCLTAGCDSSAAVGKTTDGAALADWGQQEKNAWEFESKIDRYFKSKIDRYCSSPCEVQESNCTTNPKVICWMALSTEANLLQLELCPKQQRCTSDLTKCGITSAAWTDFQPACAKKATACVGTGWGMSAGDCDDVMPLFRADVLTAFKECLNRDCTAIESCMTEAARVKEPTACSGGL